MPNRIIKETIRTSETVSALSDFEFRLWIGLIVSADDAGRGDARPAIIKGQCFPLRDRVTVKDISAALHGLAAKGCVSLYEVDGKPYFWFPTWKDHQRIRDCKPKYPEPPADSSPQFAATCGNSPQTAALIQSESNTNTNPNTKEETPAGAELPFDGILLDAFNDWLAYKQERRENYKPTGLKTLIGQIKRAADAHGDAAVAEVIRTSMASNYQGIVLDRLNKPAAPSRRRQPEFNRDQDMDNDDLGQLIESMRKES